MIADEKRTIKEMISLYCRKHNHSCSPELCRECKELLEYAYLALFLLLLAISAFLISRKNALEIVEHAFRPAEPEPGKKLWLPITLLLVWCIISFSHAR